VRQLRCRAPRVQATGFRFLVLGSWFLVRGSVRPLAGFAGQLDRLGDLRSSRALAAWLIPIIFVANFVLSFVECSRRRTRRCARMAGRPVQEAQKAGLRQTDEPADKARDKASAVNRRPALRLHSLTAGDGGVQCFPCRRGSGSGNGRGTRMTRTATLTDYEEEASCRQP
jgi:hypothetical protein